MRGGAKDKIEAISKKVEQSDRREKEIEGPFSFWLIPADRACTIIWGGQS